MSFVFEQPVAGDIRIFVQLELDCSNHASCGPKASELAEPIRKKVIIVSSIVLTVNLVNFAANLLFLLLFKVPDAETKFAETSIEEEDPVEE